MALIDPRDDDSTIDILTVRDDRVGSRINSVLSKIRYRIDARWIVLHNNRSYLIFVHVPTLYSARLNVPQSSDKLNLNFVPLRDESFAPCKSWKCRFTYNYLYAFNERTKTQYCISLFGVGRGCRLGRKVHDDESTPVCMTNSEICQVMRELGSSIDNFFWSSLSNLHDELFRINCVWFSRKVMRPPVDRCVALRNEIENLSQSSRRAYDALYKHFTAATTYTNCPDDFVKFEDFRRDALTALPHINRTSIRAHIFAKLYNLTLKSRLRVRGQHLCNLILGYKFRTADKKC